MCFSADASLATGVLLLPVGAYCTFLSLRKSIAYLPLALTPLIFGVQQLCEAGVWIGLERGDPILVKEAALTFLFFAIAFWPGWIPFVAAVLETRSRRRQLFLALAAGGFVVGFGSWGLAAWRYDEWVTVGIASNSIRYDLSRLPVAEKVGGMVWQVLYLALVCVPLLTSQIRRLQVLGISIAVSAMIAHVAFSYAFASVWCFFAALLSAHVGYILYTLPNLGVRSAHH